MTVSTRRLHGLEVPSFMYGTAWKEQRTRALTTLALEAGFRAIDTANQRRHYVEAAVGEALQAWLADGTHHRSELFLQTKFTYPDGQDHRIPYDVAAPPEEQVAQSFRSSLAQLRTSYVDSYLLHGPSVRVGLADEDWRVWSAMEALQRAGQVRLIGISNVSCAQLESLQRDAEVKPAFVQNRCYARSGWDREVRQFCRAHDIAYQGFSLLTANRRELEGAVMARIMARTGATLPQVLFRFALGLGMIALTGTSDASHMREDLDCVALQLADDEVDALERVARA